MTGPHEPPDSSDERPLPVEDETLGRVVSHLRTLRVPPLPADLFAASSEGVEATPFRRETFGRTFFGSRNRWALAVAASTIAIAASGLLVGSYLLNRFDASDENEGAVAQVVPPNDDPQHPPTRSDLAHHPRLEMLATQTADLKSRVQRLRLRAEATGVRRQADQLLTQYARRELP